MFGVGENFFTNLYSCNVYERYTKPIPDKGNENEHEVSSDSTLEENGDGKFTLISYHKNDDDIPPLAMYDIEKSPYKKGCNFYFDEDGVFHYYDNKWKIVLTKK